MDVLSDVLRVVRLDGALFFHGEFSAPWCFRSSESAAITASLSPHAGHLIILFMAGALAVILGITALGWFTLPFGVLLFAFEVGLVAALQAFIFATLTAIYLGGAVAEDH